MNVKEVIKRCKEINKEYSYFNVICENEAIKQEKDKL